MLVHAVVLGLLMFVPASAMAQQAGRVVGRVVEAEGGTPLAGAIVEVGGTGQRTTSAIDGRYVLQNVAAGTVSITVRLIGFQPKTVSGIVVAEGKVVEQNVSLASAVVELQELAVSAAAEKGSVNAAIEQQRNASNIVSSVGAEQIERAGDADAAQAVQRVSGVTVQDGKFVIVRGLGERYTTTQLNGARVPSPEPEKKLVPLDLFPSGLLEGVTTSKTFTPDQNGDFSGAQVDLKTREFPVNRQVTMSMSAGMNTSGTFVNRVRAPMSGAEWLGFASSDRNLPTDLQNAGNLSGVGQPEVNGLISQLRNVWSADQTSGIPNGGLSISVGGEDPVFGQPLGYLASFSYGVAQEVRVDETQSLVVGDTTETRRFNVYNGESGAQSILWGGLFNLSTRLGSSSKLAWNNTFTRGADNKATVLVGENDEFSQFNPIYQTRLAYIERSVVSSQLQGEHLLGMKHYVTWSGGYARVVRNEPDRSDMAYTAAPGDGVEGFVPVQWPGQPRFGVRTFTDLDENSFNGKADYRLALGNQQDPVFVKVGGAGRFTTRESGTRAYDLINRTLTADELATAPPEDLFTGDRVSASAFGLRANANGGVYNADENIYAGYGMVDLPVSGAIRVIGGLRVERWELDVETLNTFGTPILASPRATDLLPSLSVNWAFRPEMMLRFAATQTVSRPEYRELSPVPYFEQIGLLTTFGNPDLNRALVRNLDARWEWYPKAGEIVSAGVFAKFFDDPIEKVIVLEAGGQALSFVNAEQATNLGVEFEVRKGFFQAGGLPRLTTFANLTLMASDITPGNEGISALTNPNRPMVGQSPYVINAGLTTTPWNNGVALSLLYNVFGRRIVEAGAGGLPDSYEEPRHVIDAAVQWPVGSVVLKFEARNLLDAPFRLTQGDVIRQRWLLGRQLAFGVTWRL
jgi:hypothetical protein